MTRDPSLTADDRPADGPAATLTENRVVQYLLDHPDFLSRHPEVVVAMTPPPQRWSGDRVVDLQKYMLDQRRDEIDDLRGCAEDVIETSRSNMTVQTRTHAAVLAFLDARTVVDLIRVARDDLPWMFAVDVVEVGFESGPPIHPHLAASGARSLPRGTVDGLLGPERDVRLFREMTDDGTVFGAGAGLVHSAGMARLALGGGAPTGLMALGARADAFHAGQGTELLGFLARVLEACIRRCLEAPA